uniref:Uncharacterized protein n=1 Tax=Lactuca sativa TaxID=4236 RepID=A0A9R1XI30_LACSA|nr:hypothetical protein LSAT_V11C300123100 [Lactuca sativa]
MARLQNRLVCGPCVRQSCFGDYVNMLMVVECHILLCHYLISKEFTNFDPSFYFRLATIEFALTGKHSVWSLTCVSGIISIPVLVFVEFRECVFPFMLLSRSMSMADLMHVFNNLLYQLNNEDVLCTVFNEIEDNLNPNGPRVGNLDYGDISQRYYSWFPYTGGYPSVSSIPYDEAFVGT